MILYLSDLKISWDKLFQKLEFKLFYFYVHDANFIFFVDY